MYRQMSGFGPLLNMDCCSSMVGPLYLVWGLGDSAGSLAGVPGGTLPIYPGWAMSENRYATRGLQIQMTHFIAKRMSFLVTLL